MLDIHTYDRENKKGIALNKLKSSNSRDYLKNIKSININDNNVKAKQEDLQICFYI